MPTLLRCDAVVSVDSYDVAENNAHAGHYEGTELLRSCPMDLLSIATFFGLRRLVRQNKQEDGYTRAERREESWYGKNTPSLATPAEVELMQGYDERISEALRKNERN